ncbi:MAG: DNA repair protein RadA, partial [Thermoanaerobaculia bacterium]
MAAPRTIYACQACGYQSSKWLGRCPECGAWSSFVEEMREPLRAGAAARAGGGATLV